MLIFLFYNTVTVNVEIIVEGLFFFRDYIKYAEISLKKVNYLK